LSTETWLLFFVAYLVVTLSPGPNVLLVVKNAVKYGYRAAGLTILSNLVCQLLIIISVAFGAGALLAKSPILFFILKLLGGVYLIYLGITGFIKKSTPSHSQEREMNPSMHLSYHKLCKEAFFVSSSNPKTIIFLSAFLPQFLSTNTSIGWQFTIMYFTICFIVASVHLMYSYIAKNINKKWSNLKEKHFISKIANSAYIAFGCSVLFSRRPA
jgi:homoserine/homoserine lactone efflux protein